MRGFQLGKFCVSIFCFFFISGCSVVYIRNYKPVDAAEFKTVKSNGKLLIRYLPTPDTEFTYHIDNPLKEAVLSTKLFNDVQLTEYRCLNNCDSLMYSNVDNSKEFNTAYQNFPDEKFDEFNFVLDFIVRPRYVNKYSVETGISAKYTFGMMPVRREFSYEVNVRLHKGEKMIKSINLVESYASKISLLPYEGTHFQMTWEKEPLVNLIMISLKQFHEQGVL
jgi:hypothetical protein